MLCSSVLWRALCAWLSLGFAAFPVSTKEINELDAKQLFSCPVFVASVASVRKRSLEDALHSLVRSFPTQPGVNRGCRQRHGAFPFQRRLVSGRGPIVYMEYEYACRKRHTVLAALRDGGSRRLGDPCAAEMYARMRSPLRTVQPFVPNGQGAPGMMRATST
ncbi:hypothetical protein HPB50_019589 [Hyalomma asiaticum]|uniref:Uncharacterized protein n=1 Tax=Hyalomma asiaticum TaxID=266040 RepID=A0ACB7TKM5_HYAAI|nr:hypothetical protein HPB50_019589 [Hyalomma asiaticum]